MLAYSKMLRDDGLMEKRPAKGPHEAEDEGFVRSPEIPLSQRVNMRRALTIADSILKRAKAGEPLLPAAPDEEAPLKAELESLRDQYAEELDG